MKTLGRLVLQGVILAALGIMPPPLSAAPAWPRGERSEETRVVLL
jgi:hypothetical protein